MPRIWLNFFSPTTVRIAMTIGVKGPFAAILPMFKSSAPVFLSEVCQRDTNNVSALDMSPCPWACTSEEASPVHQILPRPRASPARTLPAAPWPAAEKAHTRRIYAYIRQKGTCTGRAAEAADAKDDPRSCTAAELTPKASAPPTAHAAATNASTEDLAIIGFPTRTCAMRSLECQLVQTGFEFCDWYCFFRNFKSQDSQKFCGLRLHKFRLVLRAECFLRFFNLYDKS